MRIMKKHEQGSVKKRRKPLLKILRVLLCVFLTVIIAVLLPNFYVCISSLGEIEEPSDIGKDRADCILVLGCGVNGYTPSLMLEERLDAAIELYKKGAARKLLMSGDHGGEYYNEVGVMKAYAIQHGVPSYDIFMDHAGFSTYESLYRVKEIFGCKKIIAVTQQYHLFRTVYLGKCLELDIIGVDAEKQKYSGQFFRDVREIFARDKDFFIGLFTPRPNISFEEKIDISGNGNITNDKAFEHIAKVKNISL